jgi:hypothetical protein
VQIRFRIYGGQVYDEDGRGVFVKAISCGNGHILGLSIDRNPAALFSEIYVGSQTLYKDFGDDDESPQGGEGANGVGVSDPIVGPSYTDGAGVDVLIAAIKQLRE